MHFLYYQSHAGIDESRVSSLVREVFRSPVQFRLDGAVFIIDGRSQERAFVRADGRCGYLSGYVRSYALPVDAPLVEHNRVLLGEMARGAWPLAEHFTGSFSAIAIDEPGARVVIANDPVGFYPLYYYRNASGLIISTSLSLIGGIANVEYDPTGLIQALSGPDYCNFGSRTILKDVFRLLPGEWIGFATGGAAGIDASDRKYDFSLYQGIEDRGLKAAAEGIKNLADRELEIATRFDRTVSIALSGGLDSRLLMAATPAGKDVSCVTYGEDSEYEIAIAKATAIARGGCRFRNFPVGLPHQFPQRARLTGYVRETEAVGINDWFSIVDEQKDSDEFLLVGDMTESIMGRNILSNKNARLSHFWSIAWGSPIPLTEATGDSFERWKAAKVSAITAGLMSDTDANRPFLDVGEFLKSHNLAATIDDVIRGYSRDLDEMFRLIEGHRLATVNLMDELFSWYTHGRIAMGRQILLTGYSFFSISPSMSMGMLRAVSRVHPSLRVYSRLMHAAFKHNKAWKKYSRLPTPAAPFMPQAWPLILVIGMNAVRYKADVWLARRLMRRKDATLRPRIIRCSSWPLIYSQMDSAIVDRWFEPNHIGAFASRCRNMLLKRKALEAWPLSMFDISSIAALNIQMDVIRRFQHHVWGRSLD